MKNVSNHVATAIPSISCRTLANTWSQWMKWGIETTKLLVLFWQHAINHRLVSFSLKVSVFPREEMFPERLRCSHRACTQVFSLSVCVTHKLSQFIMNQPSLGYTEALFRLQRSLLCSSIKPQSPGGTWRLSLSHSTVHKSPKACCTFLTTLQSFKPALFAWQRKIHLHLTRPSWKKNRFICPSKMTDFLLFSLFQFV